MNSNFISPDDTVIDNDTGEILQTTDSGQLAALEKAAIDQQIATAKRYPRSEDKSLKKAESLACRDEDTAGSMFYSIPRGGKHIQGPSVRLAEVLASTWGNLRVQTRVVDSNNKFVTVQAVVHDLETNLAVMVEKRRRVLAKKGRAADDDTIQIAGLAGQSIVFRDAIFKVVPRVYVDQITRKAQLTSIGKAESLVKKRDSMIAYFAKMGVGQDRVLAAVGAKGLEDIDMDSLIILKGMATAIKDGQSSIDDAFPDPAKSKEGNEGAAEVLKNAQARKEPTTKAAPEQPKAEEKQLETASPLKAEPTPEAHEQSTDVPEWVTTWERQIEMMPKFSPACLTFDDMLKACRGAEEEDKGYFFDLFESWLVKTLPFADKPSLIPLLNQKLDQLKPFVPESLFESLKKQVTEARK